MFGYCKSDPTIPIEQLDYKYIETCNDDTKLQKILQVLRSGEEGIYPDLIKFTEEHLRKRNPKSALLEKINPEKTTRELNHDEQKYIIENLQNLGDQKVNGHSSNNQLPPIRQSKNINTKTVEKEEKPNKLSQPNPTKKGAPRSYEEWSKLDQEIEKNGGDLKNTTTERSEVMQKNKENTMAPHQLIGDVKNNGITENEQEMTLKAENEKNKGNEAFRSRDFKEALVYYNRSISLQPIVAVYNNRAMTCIKLEKYKEAIDDCNVVIEAEPMNIKAFLRRGLAYQSLKKLDLALVDFTKVVEIEPKNMRGKELYETVYKELERQVKPKDKKSGTRLKVEEISSEDNINNDNNDSKHSSHDSTTTTDSTHSNASDTSINAHTSKKGKRLVIEEVDNNVNTEQSQATDIKKETTSELSVNKHSTSIITPTSSAVTNTAPPVVVAKELPDDAVLYKNEGNSLYKEGQYQKAYEKYTTALQVLMEDPISYKSALSSLFNNRAICRMKTGNCKECIHDCTKSIQYLPSVKALLRRAAAYETIEKYPLAYLDYQNAYSMDRSQTTIHAMSRLSNTLKADLGKDWREKLPKTESINWVMTTAAATPVTSSPTTTTTSNASNDNTSNNINDVKEQKEANKKAPTTTHTASTITSIMDSKVEKEKPIIKSVEEQFKETKDKGNKCVQEGKYANAIPYYTICIELLPAEVPSYTNRALCYLKLKQAKKAIDDCSTALGKQPENVKALFRRAQAKKMLKEYREALTDLTTVTKLEPKNTVAKKEIEECKDLFRTALREMQSKNETTKPPVNKKGKKMKIEEVTSENASSPNNSKRSTKVETCPMAKNNQTTTKQQNPKKMNGFEFMQVWNGIKSNNSADYADILKQIDPSKLPDLLSNKIDGEILGNFLHAVHDHFTTKEQFKFGMALMKHLSRVQRFSTMLMFLGTPEKTLLKQTIDVLEGKVKQGGKRLLQAEINQLRSQYLCPSS